MLSIVLQGYTRTCTVTTGGISNIYVFDPQDFDWTQSSANAAYSVVARRTGATSGGGAKFFPVTFINTEAEYKYTQKVTGISVEYAHELVFQVPQLGNSLGTFLTKMDAGSACFGVGVVIVSNDGTISIMGEYSVNGAPIPWFKAMFDGHQGTSGKKFGDFNGVTCTIKATYFRPLQQYAGGGIADIIALTV